MDNLVISNENLKGVNENVIGQAMATRAAKEVEAQVLIAKKFPREISNVENNILQNCRRIGLAEQAEYTFTRGGTEVSGPSIRLAEVIMQCYGNIVVGWNEIQRSADNSDCEAYAWDIENNVKVTKIFNVPHYRDTKQGKNKLTNDRDIKEMCANMASRVLRGCILQVIPGDLSEMAVQECHKTLNNSNIPLPEQFGVWAERFEREFKVTKSQLAKYLGFEEAKIKITNTEIHRLRKLYNMIKNGEITVEDALNIHTAKLSGTQIKEIAKIIVAKGEKQSMLFINTLGYAELKDIPAAEFESIKTALEALEIIKE
jgi:hypothetical protein